MRRLRRAPPYGVPFLIRFSLLVSLLGTEVTLAADGLATQAGASAGVHRLVVVGMAAFSAWAGVLIFVAFSRTWKT